jgi:predicted helicase
LFCGLLGERKVNLDDDYVKFIRFGQWRIDRTGSGVLAFVTNHAFLDNPTFRQMRRSLMASFDHMSVLDLHGDSRRGETDPDGSKDENVFDIQQGVSISLLVRHERPEQARQVRFSELWGARASKYARLLGGFCESTDWKALHPSEPHLLFAPQDDELSGEYVRGTPVTEMFGDYTTAIQTARDSLVVGFTAEEVRDKLGAFADATIPNEVMAARYRVTDGRGWTVGEARRMLRDAGVRSELVMPYSYRPYDQRAIYYSPIVVAWPRTQIAQHVAGRSNLVLLCTRNSNDPASGVALVSRGLADKRLLAGSRGEAKFFYLYKWPSRTDSRRHALEVAKAESAEANLNLTFVRSLAQATGFRFVSEGFGDCREAIGPEGILAYVFAILSSPCYRNRYSDFLRSDFPRIPLASDRELFRELCRLGSRLVTLHLMEADDVAPITTYPVPGDNRVEKVRYNEPGQGGEQGRVWINATQHFDGVPPEVWEFHVGGYQVCEKWLKDRKGRHLTYDDLTHYQYVAAALAETISLMQEIDEVIEAHGGWPLK